MREEITVTIEKETYLSSNMMFTIKVNGITESCKTGEKEALNMFDTICNNIIKFNGLSKTEIIKTQKI